jgi:hypothetical protein
VFCFEFSVTKGKHPVVETGSFVDPHVMGVNIFKTQEPSPSAVPYWYAALPTAMPVLRFGCLLL